MTTTDKKEADQYDKMLDIGDNIVQLLVQQGISADDALLEDIGIALSQNKAALQEVLRGRPLPAIEEAQDA